MASSRDGRQGTTADLFAATDPADLVVGLKDAVGTALAAGATLSATEWAVLDVWLLEAEVYNGGFHQFFWNSAGDRAVETVASLERIGAPVTAGIVARAVAVFGAAPSPDRETRVSQMDAWTETEKAVLSALDEVFWKDPEPRTALLAEHCRSHETAFSGR